MPLPKRIVKKIEKHDWPRQVGETRVVSPYSFGRGTVERDFEYTDGTSRTFQSWDASPPKERASIILGLTKKGQVIVIIQYCHAVMEPVIEIAGGVPDNEDESDYDAAAREFLEETGFRPGLIVNLGFVYWEPHNKTLKFAAFLALDCEAVEKTARTDTTESLFVELLTWDEWMAICQDSSLVRDNKSLAVTFLAMPILRSHGIIS